MADREVGERTQRNADFLREFGREVPDEMKRDAEIEHSRRSASESGESSPVAAGSSATRRSLDRPAHIGAEEETDRKTEFETNSARKPGIRAAVAEISAGDT